jgi:hypothetical protein
MEFEISSALMEKLESESWADFLRAGGEAVGARQLRIGAGFAPGTRQSRDVRLRPGVVTTGDVSGVSAGGGGGPGETMEVPTLTVVCHEGRPPADAIFSHAGCCPQPVPSRPARPGP